VEEEGMKNTQREEEQEGVKNTVREEEEGVKNREGRRKG
jgi:hypothetical protein